MAHNVGVVFGGPSPEHDVSIITGLQALHALGARHGAVMGLYWSKVGEWWVVGVDAEPADFAAGVPDGAEQVQLSVGRGGGFLRKGKLTGTKPLGVDVVVNCCHGGPGEDGSLQGALDLAGLRYTGTSGLASAVGMDKFAFGSLIEQVGLPTLPRATYRTTVETPPNFASPYIVKPRFGGSSVGIEVVDDANALEALIAHGIHYRQGAVVEPYLAGSVDLNVAIRSHPTLQLSAIERPLRDKGAEKFLSFSAKYTAVEGMAGAARELPAELDPAVEERIRECALAIGRQLPVRGVCRLDFLLSGDVVYVNEINTIPGSLAKYLWVEPAISFVDLLDGMIAEAVEHATYQPSVEGADGALLRDAGSIAAKLR